MPLLAWFYFSFIWTIARCCTNSRWQFLLHTACSCFKYMGEYILFQSWSGWIKATEPGLRDLTTLVCYIKGFHRSVLLTPFHGISWVLQEVLRIHICPWTLLDCTTTQAICATYLRWCWSISLVMDLFLILGFQSKRNCAALPTWSKVTFFPAISTPVPPKPIFSTTLVMVQEQTIVSRIVKDFGSEAMA